MDYNNLLHNFYAYPMARNKKCVLCYINGCLRPIKFIQYLPLIKRKIKNISDTHENKKHFIYGDFILRIVEDNAKGSSVDFWWK